MAVFRESFSIALALVANKHVAATHEHTICESWSFG